MVQDEKSRRKLKEPQIVNEKADRWKFATIN